MVVCLFAGGSCAGYLWQKNQVHQLGRRIRHLEQELGQLERGNETLQQRYSALTSHSALKQRVREFGLNLREPAPEQILRIRETDDGQKVSTPGGRHAVTGRYSDRR